MEYASTDDVLEHRNLGHHFVAGGVSRPSLTSHGSWTCWVSAGWDFMYQSAGAPW